MRKNGKEATRKSGKSCNRPNDNNCSLGPPIGVYFYPQRVITEAGLTLSIRGGATREARIAWWDGPRGFVVCPYARGDLFAATNAAESMQRVASRLCKEAKVLFLGELIIREDRKMMRFDGYATQERAFALKILAYRTFGYPGIDEKAAEILSANPLVLLNVLPLGSLQEIIASVAQDAYSENSNS